MSFLKTKSKSHRIAIIVVMTIIIFVAVDLIVSAFMMHGIDKYYGLDRKSEILLIGHSHLMLATDKARMEKELGVPVSKYCREGVTVSDRLTMVRHFLDNGNADYLRCVLYGVDLYSFTGEGLSANSYKLFYPFLDNPDVDKYVKEEANASDYWLHKLIRSTRFNDDGLKNSAFRGWFNNWDNMKFNTIDVESYRKQLAKGGERSIEMNDTLITQFKQTVKLLTDKGIKVVMVNTPTLDLLNGYQPDKYSRMIDWFREYASTDSLIYYWDYNPAFSGNHTIFSDRLHLNSRGQQLITTQLISNLRQLNL